MRLPHIHLHKGLIYLIAETVKNLIWGMPTVGLILCVGFYFTVRSRWLPILGIKEIAKKTIGSLGKSRSSGLKGVTPFMAVATAIGGTVGVGSIIGTGYAIITGGAGSLFWMWISGFFGMMIKYAEVAISVNHRKKTPKGYVGGAMYLLESVGHKRLGILFCLLCIIASFGVGNLAQTNAVSVILDDLGIAPIHTAVIISLFFGLIIFGGQKKIAKINGIIVPLVSLIYLACTVYILFLYRSGITEALVCIFKDAFGLNAAVGGFSGAMLSRAIRVGFARGVFSNEAGMGSSPIAHSAAENADPHTQGLWGIVEIFIDTFIVTTLTGLVLLCSKITDISELFYCCFGNIGRPLLAFLLTVFAYASMISWCFYSEGCIYFLTDKKSCLFLYRFVAVVFAFVGALSSVDIIWNLADIFNGLMIFPNMFLLFIKRKEIIKITKRG